VGGVFDVAEEKTVPPSFLGGGVNAATFFRGDSRHCFCLRWNQCRLPFVSCASFTGVTAP